MEPLLPLGRASVPDPGPASLRKAKRTTIDAKAITAAALDLFAERGYLVTTMDDVGAALGIRGPSLYKHVRSKQALLASIIFDTMETLLVNQQAALSAGGDAATRLRRAVEAHVRYHAAHRKEAFIRNREIDRLEPVNRERALELLRRYEHGLRDLIEEGCARNDFAVPSARLASYALLDMGMGVAVWFRADGELTADEVAYAYAEYALRMVTNPALATSSAGRSSDCL